MFDKSTFENNFPKPFIKWPGGKSSELEIIHNAAPLQGFQRFIDPFVGGGSLLYAIKENIPAACNDLCLELINLYAYCKNNDQNFQKLAVEFCAIWDTIKLDEETLKKISPSFHTFAPLLENTINISLPELKIDDHTMFVNFPNTVVLELNRKLIRTKKVSEKHQKLLSEADIEKTIIMVMKSVIYTEIRNRYNQLRNENVDTYERTLWFFFLREYAYAAMFRFNSRNEFNVPYGGISYNDKKFSNKIDILFSEKTTKRIMNTDFYNFDYKFFLKEIKPQSTDFIFIDPPYDSIFSDYDNSKFDQNNQIELRDVLDKLDAQIMIVIGDTPFIRSLYTSSKWKINTTDKSYMWNIKSRNDGKTKHLVITNY